jgi:hypothetical protein
MVRGMGFEPMQPYGNRFLKAVPIPIQTFCYILGSVLLSLSPLAKLGHPRDLRRVQMLNQHLLLYLFSLLRVIRRFSARASKNNRQE